MSILKNIKAAAMYFVLMLLGNNPSDEQVAQAVTRLPNIRPLADYPRPNRQSGVAAAKRAAGKARRYRAHQRRKHKGR
ncbi:hypothetical protein [Neisseria montereyensis]|uniref:Uncharacterized protein n=1 Tax=Neisseria montereyensis TaxID=2973938 RepID=A0ABT2FDG6_9NEIS|nr:hypothetical protein [Neisseria montereyensis]MCS4534259.1 hypothetical protein [Neisseria montereyensis]